MSERDGGGGRALIDKDTCRLFIDMNQMNDSEYARFFHCDLTVEIPELELHLG